MLVIPSLGIHPMVQGCNKLGFKINILKYPNGSISMQSIGLLFETWMESHQLGDGSCDYGLNSRSHFDFL